MQVSINSNIRYNFTAKSKSKRLFSCKRKTVNSVIHDNLKHKGKVKNLPTLEICAFYLKTDSFNSVQFYLYTPNSQQKVFQGISHFKVNLIEQ